MKTGAAEAAGRVASCAAHAGAQAAVLPARPQVELTAWAFDAEEGKAYRPCGTHSLRQPG
ncbi:MAG: hypothetical protein LC672_00275 [Acidobacteria bacterium]|nr:hypothetical protein [Acidobacteriota bacterium]